MRPLVPLAALALLAPALLLGSAAANHTGMPLAYTTTASGPASFGVRVDPDASGAFALQITSCGTKGGSTDGVGVLLFRADRSLRFGFLVTGHYSNDRQLIDLGFGLVDHEVVVQPNWGPICPYTRVEVQLGGAPATHYAVIWAAGLDGPTKLDVFGGAGTGVAVNLGSALALGDPEMRDAFAQAQAQQRLPGSFHGVGAKAMLMARADVAVGTSLYGMWGFNDAKFACASLCVGTMTAEQACITATGGTCLTQLGWAGPQGQGGGGSTGFLYLGNAPGDYAFRVDRKVDAYNPGGGAFLPPGVLVFPGENYSFLSIADVALPP